MTDENELRAVEVRKPLVESNSKKTLNIKDWKIYKKKTEDIHFTKLITEFENDEPENFERCLEICFNELYKIYSMLEVQEKPKQKKDKVRTSNDPTNSRVEMTNNEENVEEIIEDPTYKKVLKNDQMHLLLAKMCRKEGSSDFIKRFLYKVPILNYELDRFSEVPTKIRENPQQPKLKQEKEPNRAIHIAIKAKAFDNVKTLLNYPGVDVNVVWRFKKYTPLMMLITIVDSENFYQIKELMEILASKEANINLGTFTMHPLSAICKLDDEKFDKKAELLKFCSNNFSCDLDGLYGGQTRKDIEELKIAGLIFNYSPAADTYELLQSLITKNTEKEFAKRFDNYSKSAKIDDVYKLLELAALKGCDVCVQKMFNFLNIDKQYTTAQHKEKQMELSKVLKVVCQSGFVRVLKHLLENIKSGIDNKHPLLLICLRELGKSQPKARRMCFQMLLNDRRIAIHASDDRKQTALHYAVQHGMDQEAKEILLRKPPPYLWKKNLQNETPLHSMNPEVLEAFLDSQISILAETDKKKHEIYLDLQGFKPQKLSSESEISPFYYIAESKELQSLLRHPVISTFILVKWLLIRWITYAMFAVSCLFASSFFLYSLTNYSKLNVLCWVSIALYLVRWAYITLIPILMILQQWIIKKRINLRRIHWFRSLNNLRETVMIFLAAYSLRSNNNAILSVLILLAGIDVIVHLRLFPNASLITSIVMLETVSKSFLKILLIYLIIIISFGCSFFVLFANYASQDQSVDITQNSTTKEDFNNFSSLEGSLVKSLVMMIGELDASDIEFNGHKLSYILFICFVFFVTLVVSNLINGVAVSDITEIRQQSQVTAFANRVEMLRRFEKCLSFNWFSAAPTPAKASANSTTATPTSRDSAPPTPQPRFSQLHRQSLIFTCYQPKIIIRTNEANQLVLIKKKSNSPKQKASTDQPQSNQESKAQQKTNHLERKFNVLCRNGYLHHGVDEETCKEAKNIAYRNLANPLSFEAIMEEMDNRLSSFEEKLTKTIKYEFAKQENQTKKVDKAEV